MAVFLYYIPNKAVLKIKDIESAGVKGIFEENTPRIDARVITNGPDGGTGMICAMDVPGRPQIGCYLDRQAWQKVGDYWIGYDKENPPKPESIARKNNLAGHLVKLAHDEWLVPCARHFFPEYGSPLPKVFALGPDGNMVEEPDPRYAELCQGADRSWYWFCKDFGMEEYLGEIEEPDRPSMADRYNFAAMALAINYRLTAAELLVRREITTESLLDIEKAVFDWPSVVAFSEAASKKNNASTPDGSDSEDTAGVK